MKKILLAAFAVAFLSVGKAAVADINIGVVDLGEVIKKSSLVDKMHESLKKKFEPRSQKIGEEQKKFQTMVNDFNKNAPTMKSEEKKATQQKLSDEQKRLQELQTQLQRDVMEAQDRARQELTDSLKSAAAKVAEKRKLNLIINQEITLYSDRNLNVTSDVMDQMKK